MASANQNRSTIQLFKGVIGYEYPCSDSVSLIHMYVDTIITGKLYMVGIGYCENEVEGASERERKR